MSPESHKDNDFHLIKNVTTEGKCLSILKIYSVPHIGQGVVRFPYLKIALLR